MIAGHQNFTVASAKRGSVTMRSASHCRLLSAFGASFRRRNPADRRMSRYQVSPLRDKTVRRSTSCKVPRAYPLARPGDSPTPEPQPRCRTVPFRRASQRTQKKGSSPQIHRRRWSPSRPVSSLQGQRFPAIRVLYGASNPRMVEHHRKRARSSSTTVNPSRVSELLSSPQFHQSCMPKLSSTAPYGRRAEPSPEFSTTSASRPVLRGDGVSLHALPELDCHPCRIVQRVQAAPFVPVVAFVTVVLERARHRIEHTVANRAGGLCIVGLFVSAKRHRVRCSGRRFLDVETEEVVISPAGPSPDCGWSPSSGYRSRKTVVLSIPACG